MAEKIWVTGSNFADLRLDYPIPLLYRGIEYSNAWTAYVAQKLNSDDLRRHIADFNGIKAATFVSRTHDKNLDKDFDGSCLENILHLKFLHKKTRQNLLLTGDRRLLYDWVGVGFILGCKESDTYEGEIAGYNDLGIMLEKVREMYLKSTLVRNVGFLETAGASSGV